MADASSRGSAILVSLVRIMQYDTIQPYMLMISELGLPVIAIHAQIKKMYKTKYCQQTTFMKIPGNGPSPGGRNNVPRILPSLTGTLFTPSAMYDF